MTRGSSDDVWQRAREYFRGKRVMVTGVCGTIGQRLASYLVEHFEMQMLIGIDNNESELALLEESYAHRGNARFLLGDVRDLGGMLRESRTIEVLFHAAAYKHVYLCERSPLEAIQTNVLGVQNIVQAAVENGIERLVFTSSDKAVNPTNVMGTSKLMGERLITAAAIDSNHAGAFFLSTRFGNVLGSRGSVIPIFRDQIRKGGPVTLTNPEMTRFIMSLEDAVQLVIESAVIGQAGDVLITKMKAIRIADLAAVMVREYAQRCGHRPQDIEIRLVGPKPGEKLYEELMNEEEIRRSLELERYFVVRPALAMGSGETSAYEGLVRKSVEQPYNSVNVQPLSQEELAAFLYDNGLIDAGRRGDP
jgi:FlaA1/EpsC-like NDP-sugar epimerase